MDDRFDGTAALPLSDTNALLRSAAQADKQQALIAHIYPLEPSPSSSSHVDVVAQLSTLRAKLDAYLHRHACANPKIGGPYIWHRDPPTLSISLPPPTSLAANSASASSPNDPTTPSVRLHLRTGGDCVEDEWFITYILCMATRDAAYFGTSLAVSIQDEDGQFILIEAAEALPKWVSPDNVDNRVWIHQGRLHLVPLEIRSATMPAPRIDSQDEDPDHPATITVSDAIRAVSDPSIFTGVSDAVQEAAFARIQDYPLAAADHHHTTLAYLSRRLACVLQADPQLVSRATEALTTRDVISSRAAMRMKRFPCRIASEAEPSPMDQDGQGDPNSSSMSAGGKGIDQDEVVLTPVRMTRHLYAQLCYDRFFPPRAFGKPWQMAVEKYRLRMQQGAQGGSRGAAAPAVEDEDDVQRELREGRWRDIGAKVWCGLEMAYEESASRRGKSKRNASASSFDAADAASETAAGDDHAKFVASLRKLGYFGDEIEGSAKWKQLEADAVSQLRKLKVTPANSGADAQDEEAHQRGSVSDKVDALLSDPHTAAATGDIKVVSPTSSPAVLASLEDSEDWMVVTTEDLDTMLESRFVPRQSSQQQMPSAAQASEEDKALDKLKRFASKMDQFMKTQSDERGAAFLDELDDDEKEDWDGDDDDLMLDDDLDDGDDDDDDDDDKVGEEGDDEQVDREVQKRLREMDEGERSQRLEKILPGLAGIWATGSSTKEGAAPAPAAPSAPTSTPAASAVAAGGTAMAEDAQRDDRPPSSPTSTTQKPEGLADVLDRLSSTHSLHIATAAKDASNALVQPPPGSAATKKLHSQLASQEMRATSTLLSRQQNHYDGASDSDSELEQETSAQVRKELAREYDVRDDDDEEGAAGDWLRGPGDEEGGDVVEDEGEEEFLEFVRTSLGLTREQYAAVMERRRKEGRYVPEVAAAPAAGSGAARGDKAAAADAGTKPASSAARSPAALRPRPDITSFDEAMDEIDSHIASLPRQQQQPAASGADTGKDKTATPPSAESSKPSAEEEQDLSLLSSLLASSGNDAADLPRTLLQHLPPDLLKQLDEEAGEEGDKVHMLRQFLKSQGAGAVGVLAGRLGVGAMPRGDEQDMDM
ncbi:uncharacterized protein PFL1_03639 [Pseudozyma flocculosa PF-1]|uniref:SGT1 protein n=2 Tax=Pseudozyma flocculosa TaxID=84751 RepID=A0A5C3F4D5_9BASI|nr:uncharacterized protein PFL1_03639 [Pseudozyma flocculosa PF-1]EPQ28836.1 hypothetical protein PFL1_03639 [Pseudozyma flocculosa PF-1]SPO39373.1 uncharacterized protein PSFLO_04854 [Pseudozyma flocculosa]